MVHRISWGYGVHKAAFLVLDVLDEGGKARVKVAEGDFFCNPLTMSCSKLGLTEHVRRWLNGERPRLQSARRLLLTVPATASSHFSA